MLINQVLRRKGSEVATIAATATVADAVTSLATHGVGALVVSSDGTAVDGIVSERDIVRAIARTGPGILDEPVSQIMTNDVVTCGLDATTEELMVQMTERRFRHVPVVESDSLVGIVSIGDVVITRVNELEVERQQLSNYIMGR